MKYTSNLEMRRAQPVNYFFDDRSAKQRAQRLCQPHYSQEEDSCGNPSQPQTWRDYLQQRGSNELDNFIFGSFSRDLFMLSVVITSFIFLVKDSFIKYPVIWWSLCSISEFQGCELADCAFWGFLIVWTAAAIIMLYSWLGSKQTHQFQFLETDYKTHKILRRPSKAHRISTPQLARESFASVDCNKESDTIREDSVGQIIVPLIESDIDHFGRIFKHASNRMNDGSYMNAFNTPMCEQSPAASRRASSHKRETPFKLLESVYAFLPTMAPPNTPRVRSRRRPSTKPDGKPENLWEAIGLGESGVSSKETCNHLYVSPPEDQPLVGFGAIPVASAITNKGMTTEPVVFLEESDLQQRNAHQEPPPLPPPWTCTEQTTSNMGGIIQFQVSQKQEVAWNNSSGVNSNHRYEMKIDDLVRNASIRLSQEFVPYETYNTGSGSAPNQESPGTTTPARSSSSDSQSSKSAKAKKTCETTKSSVHFELTNQVHVFQKSKIPRPSSVARYAMNGNK